MRFVKIKAIHTFFKKKGTDRPIYFCTFLLCVFGVFMIGDASVGMAITKGSAYATLNMVKQILFLIIGGALMVFIARMRTMSSRSFNQERKFLNIAYIVVLLAMFVCRLWNINGSHAWIKLGPITVQPSEFMKIVLILYLSMIFGRWSVKIEERYEQRRRAKKLSGASKAQLHALSEKNRDYKIRSCVYMPLAIAGMACLTCAFLQKDLGSALIMFAICLCIFLANPDPFFNRFKKAILIAIPVVTIFVLVVSKSGIGGLADHQLSRFASWLDPTNKKFIYGSSYQVVNGLVGYTNGGLIGRGLGNSVMKYGYIPEAQNDYISAIITEEFGLFGMLLVMVPYIVIIFRLFEYAYKVNDIEDKLTLIGVASYFFLHLFVNVGGVSGLIPMTGVPLLLVSAGGTSTVAALCGIGFAQSIISRYNHKVLQEEAEKEVS